MMSPNTLVFVLMTLLASTLCLAAEGSMTKLIFVQAGHNVWKASISGKEVLLSGKDKTNRSPEVWTGDLQIRDLKTGQLCNTNTDMIGEVYARKNGKILIAITEVGAGDYFNFFDIDTCKSKYPELHGYSKRPHIKNNVIVSGPVCEQLLNENKAFCSSAEVYVLDVDDRPVFQEKESMDRTVQVLGVGFKGGRMVENPNTKNAKLLPEETEDGWFTSLKKMFSH